MTPENAIRILHSLGAVLDTQGEWFSVDASKVRVSSAEDILSLIRAATAMGRAVSRNEFEELKELTHLQLIGWKQKVLVQAPYVKLQDDLDSPFGRYCREHPERVRALFRHRKLAADLTDSIRRAEEGKGRGKT